MVFNLFQSMNKFDMAYRFEGMIRSLFLLSKIFLAEYITNAPQK